jgi:hypothetical protein
MQRQEMEALKESVKHTQDVGEGTAQRLESMSMSISRLAQSVQDSIVENNQNMMLAIFQMLQGVGFSPRLQSLYSQGQYPLALGFESPTDVHPNPLPVPVPAINPPPILAGVPAPVFARTEQTILCHVESANINTEESVPTCTQGGGTTEAFARAKQNELSKASQNVPDCPLSRDDIV